MSTCSKGLIHTCSTQEVKKVQFFLRKSELERKGKGERGANGGLMGMLDPAVAIPAWSSRCGDFTMIRRRVSRDTEYDGLHSIY